METTIIGYLASRPRDDVIFQARQELTRIWWNARREQYEIVVSQLVLDEASAGDEDAAAQRLALLDGVPLLDVTDPRVDPIADALLAARLLPPKARSDAEHMATATVHGVDYLLTWNCKHIANAETLPRVYRLLTDLGYSPPLIVTPEEFSENA
ncbi:MAG: type II toxin-antitoxin system VapC family toxin [Planctomycetes bacterium]|nr:type II toxin-antitoxin system VapC family toxin [Planctomycetota bacterium]